MTGPTRQPEAAGLPHPDRCVVMGVLNVTPDSFSDGGRYADLDAAVAHGLAMRAAGADIVDVGGESTRPGAERVDAEQETRRVVPAIRALAAGGVPVSVDTTRAAVAEAALDAGARIVNDVSGGLADPAMAKTIAAAGVPWVLMHWRGHSRDMQALARYGDVVRDVRTELSRQVDAALAAGVDAGNIVLDPGLGRLLAGPDGTPAPVDAREYATVATSVLAAMLGAWGVRVHEVRPTVDAVKVVRAWRSAGRG
jgi:dihydropteroate synthase